MGPALRLPQQHPDQAWMAAGFAGGVGLSRAALPRPFTEVVGEPWHLAARRLALAADLLLDPHLTLAGVARQVG